MLQVYEDFLRAELSNSITLDGQQILCDRVSGEKAAISRGGELQLNN